MLGLFFNLHLQILPQNEFLHNNKNRYLYNAINSATLNRNMLFYP